ncbi:MAG: low-specificity L-threonine aldolase [Bacteroidetes bacterium]|nr:low-specificity L-threonine aldolase [Bacteroidota bacterium]
MYIDFRSDTVTKPSTEMKEAMMAAVVGDDVFGDDPTVNKLQDMAAKLFTKEAALFCPSGTMANQIAIKIHTNSPGELICDELAHVYKYEGGGIGFNSGLATKLLKGNKGRLTAELIGAAINPDDIHFPPTQLVCLENTCNKGGGSIYDFEEIKKINNLCKDKLLKLHLDGARIFNAIVESNYTSQEIGDQFDTISVCLSKGLGAPVGSLLIGSNEDIKKAKRIRKILGGGMRQAGYLAAAGIYALENNINRLKEDHHRAKLLADELCKLKWVKEVFPVYTNILIIEILPHLDVNHVIHTLEKNQIKVAAFGSQQIRFVTHLDVNDEMINRTIEIVKKINF